MVISGISFYEGGPLSVYYDFMDALRRINIRNEFHIIALVYKKELFDDYTDVAKIIEFPRCRKNYFIRMYFELIYFYIFSKRLEIDIWISLQDITPNVIAKKKYTYCHNPLPFLKRTQNMVLYDKRVLFLSFIYKYIYKININKATALIVQQDWMRNEFYRLYRKRNIIVARPNVVTPGIFGDEERTDKYVFIYASYPRVFKNYEVLLEACRMCEEKIDGFELWITIDGTENKYSKALKNKYDYLSCVRWMGLLEREELYRKYNMSNCLIFPSLLETWGLPISEYKSTGNPMILADMPYAHETLGKYDNVVFFNPGDAQELCNNMEKAIKDEKIFNKHVLEDVMPPFAQNWNELIKIITA